MGLGPFLREPTHTHGHTNFCILLLKAVDCSWCLGEVCGSEHVWLVTLVWELLLMLGGSRILI